MIHTLSRPAKIGILVSVLLGMFLAALDQTIVGTALPKVVADLKGFTEYSWVVAAYLIGQAVAVPISSKLSDIYGRKVIFFFNVIIFLVGSMLCGAAHSMLWLIGARALQGIGGGGLAAGAFTIIADIFPPRERGKWTGLIGAIFGLSSVIGPTLGGYITDHYTWRWVFYINVPVGIVALIVAAFALPNIKRDVAGKVDWLGSATMAAAVIPLLLALVWGGTKYAWGSSQILGLFGIFLVMTPIFIWVEKLAADPILPLRLFKNRIFNLGNSVVMVSAALMFGGILYIPIFIQTVLGKSATNSGLILIPLTVGVVVGSIVSGQIVSRLGRYRTLGLTAFAVTVLAMFMLSRININTTNAMVIFEMVLLGVGIGPSLPLLPIIIQNDFGAADIGVVSGAVIFFRTIGAAIGTSLLGTIFNNQLSSGLKNISTDLPTQIAAALRDANVVTSKAALDAVLSHIPAPALQALQPGINGFLALAKISIADSIAVVFTVCTGLAAISFVLFFMMEEKELRSSHGHDNEVPV
jgi:EmrB/QacA subfamily drug resistance transporter